MDVDQFFSAGATMDEVLAWVDGLLAGEPNRVANLANLAALFHQYLTDVNWVGFYLRETATEDFVLGPFAGKPACTRIGLGRGVVGTCAQKGETLVVEDVDAFPGHIACDMESRSELVVPVKVDGRVVAVIDLDSPSRGRFHRAEAQLFEAVAARLGQRWPSMTVY